MGSGSEQRGGGAHIVESFLYVGDSSFSAIAVAAVEALLVGMLLSWHESEPSLASIKRYSFLSCKKRNKIEKSIYMHIPSQGYQRGSSGDLECV